MGEWLTEAEAAEHCRVGRPMSSAEAAVGGCDHIAGVSKMVPSEKSGLRVRLR